MNELIIEKIKSENASGNIFFEGNDMFLKFFFPLSITIEKNKKEYTCTFYFDSNCLIQDENRFIDELKVNDKGSKTYAEIRNKLENLLKKIIYEKINQLENIYDIQTQLDMLIDMVKNSSSLYTLGISLTNVQITEFKITSQKESNGKNSLWFGKHKKVTIIYIVICVVIIIAAIGVAIWFYKYYLNSILEGIV